MDSYTSRCLSFQLVALDAAVARKDPKGINGVASNIDAMLRNCSIGSAEPSLAGTLPRWIQDVIRDQGISVPALAQAVGGNKLVFLPTFGGDHFGIELRLSF
jgi:hypothetical protein